MWNDFEQLKLSLIIPCFLLIILLDMDQGAVYVHKFEQFIGWADLYLYGTVHKQQAPKFWT